MCACVLTIALTVSLCRPIRSRMRLTSSPGSTTSASRVTGSPMIEQLHCSIPTGMEMCRNPCFSAPTAGVGSAIQRSIAFDFYLIIARQKAPRQQPLLHCLLHCGKAVNRRRRHMQAPEPARIIETPLAPLHQQAGAKMGEWFGCTLPDDLGDWNADSRFA